MSEERGPLEDLIRTLAGDPEPSVADTENAREQLAAEIAKASSRPTARPLVLVAVATIAVIAIIGVFGLRPTPVEASIREILRAAQPIDLTGIDEQEFVFYEIEDRSVAAVPAEGLGDVDYEGTTLHYVLPRTQQVYVGSEGVTRIITTVDEPVFFDPADAVVYVAAGIDIQDGVGKTETLTVAGDTYETWPETSDELEAAVEDVLSLRGESNPIDYLSLILQILQNPTISSTTRRATIPLLNKVDGLESGSQTVSGLYNLELKYDDGGITRVRRFSIDADGYLRHDESVLTWGDPTLGLPPDTVMTSVNYTAPTVVDSLP